MKRKGEITRLIILYYQFNNKIGYEITIEFEDKPKLMLGKCEVKQSG